MLWLCNIFGALEIDAWNYIMYQIQQLLNYLSIQIFNFLGTQKLKYAILTTYLKVLELTDPHESFEGDRQL